MRDSRSVIHGTVGQLYMEEQVSYIWIIGSVMYGIKDQFYKGQQVSYIYTVCQQVIGSRRVIHVAGGQ